MKYVKNLEYINAFTGDSCNTDCGEGGICAFDETSGESTTDIQICVCADGYENENGGPCTRECFTSVENLSFYC